MQESNSRLKLLYRQSKYLTLATRQTLVSALALSHFDYACSAPHGTVLDRKRAKDRPQGMSKQAYLFCVG